MRPTWTTVLSTRAAMEALVSISSMHTSVSATYPTPATTARTSLTLALPTGAYMFSSTCVAYVASKHVLTVMWASSAFTILQINL